MNRAFSSFPALLILALAGCHDETNDSGNTADASWAGLGGSAWNVPHSVPAPQGSANGGGVSQTSEVQTGPVFSVGGSGQVGVAWINGSPESRLYFRQWDGTNWKELAGSASGGGLAQDVSMACVALNGEGAPFACWVHSYGSTSDVYLRFWNGTYWEDLGGSSDLEGVSKGGASSTNPAMVVDSSGRPLIAWEEKQSGDSEIFLRRWNGSLWVELGGSADGGGISNTSADSELPALALDSSGNPVVVWYETVSGYKEIYLRRWNGNTWEELGASASGGGISNTSADSELPALALDSSGNPVVAWLEEDLIYLRRWSGSTWEELGGSASGTGIVGPGDFGNSLVNVGILWDGNPAVSWGDDETNSIYLAKWSGSSWEVLGDSDPGGVSGNLYVSVELTMAVDSTGMPVLGWLQDVNDGWEMWVKRWNGSSWAGYGTSSGGGGISTTSVESHFPTLELDTSGLPTVAWHESLSGNPNLNNVYLRRWNGTAWEELGGSASNHGVSNNTDSFGWSFFPSVDIESNGNPVVAWNDWRSSEGTVVDSIYLRRWNGSSWVELGGSASSSGISGTSTTSQRPSLALNGNDHPVVAWKEDLSPDEIYLRRWNGASWEELGSSGSGTGLSTTSGSSSRPALALDAGGNPVVAWRDHNSSGYQVYLKKWDGTAWQELGGSASGSGISGSTTNSETPVLALDGSGNPMVAWKETVSGFSRIYLKNWNGSSWVELAGSATGDGVPSSSWGNPTDPSICVDSSGNPMVAWEDNISGNREILVLRWNGTAWQEHLSGSGMGGGISNSGSVSYQPRMALQGSTVGVAWVDWGTTTSDIYYRQATAP